MFAIISAELKTNEAIPNVLATNALAVQLNRAGFDATPAQGYYDGQVERSFVVPFRQSAYFQKVLDLARMFGQESVLYVNDAGQAALYYLDGRANAVEQLGKFVEATSTDGLIGYTIINGRIYTAK